MELINFGIWAGLFTEIYDSNAHYENDECIDLLFLNKLPIGDNINIEILPQSVLYKLFKDVDFNKFTNVISFKGFINKINKLSEYKIYIDNWGAFRRIMVYVNGKTVYLVNMYY